MVSPDTVLLALASIIVLGFLGHLVFRRTRISDILVLVGLGLLLAQFTVGVDIETFQALAPVVGALALLVILFEGGLDFVLRDLLHGLGRAFALAALGFGLSVLLVALVAHEFLETDWLRGILLGCILGGPSSVAVLPIVRRFAMSERTRVILGVESALTDVFCVVGALTVAEILVLQERPGFETISRSIGTGFFIAIAFGVAAGALWLKFLDANLAHGINYMLSIAAILLLSVAVGALHGNGPVSVLVFGIMVGNAKGLRRVLRIKSEGFGPDLRAFQGEVAFVTRAFFFVYLGLILDPGEFTLRFVGVGLLVVAALVAARLAAVVSSVRGARDLSPDFGVWWVMLPRGLATAVLASVPSFTFGIRGTENFTALAALVIVATNGIAGLAGWLVPPAPRTRSGTAPPRGRQTRVPGSPDGGKA